jgi:hypothetical protein
MSEEQLGPEIVLICGSRTWTDEFAIARQINRLHEDSIVITGGANGADRIAEEYCAQRGIHCAVMEPLWRKNKKRAGHIRNAAMLRLRPDRVLAFTHGSPGTQGTIDRARALQIPVEIVSRSAR